MDDDGMRDGATRQFDTEASIPHASATVLDMTRQMSPEELAGASVRSLDGKTIVLAEGTQGSQYVSGQLVGKYRLLDMLGVGGQGEVWKATDTMLGVPVALKFVLDPSTVPFMLDEAALQAKFREHPNIASIHDFIQPQGTLPAYIVQAFIDGAVIDRRAAQRDTTNGQLLAWYRDAARAVDAVHGAGFIHRDIKPGNLMVDKGGKVFLLDYGLAMPRARGMSREAFQVGSPPWQAPEQTARLPGKGIDERTDVYALGQVFLELYTGRRVHDLTRITTLNELYREITARVPGWAAERDHEPTLIARMGDAYARAIFGSGAWLVPDHPIRDAIETTRAFLRAPVVAIETHVRERYDARTIRDLTGCSTRIDPDGRPSSMDEIIATIDRGDTRFRRIAQGVKGTALAAILGFAAFYGDQIMDKNPRRLADADFEIASGEDAVSADAYSVGQQRYRGAIDMLEKRVLNIFDPKDVRGKAEEFLARLSLMGAYSDDGDLHAAQTLIPTIEATIVARKVLEGSADIAQIRDVIPEGVPDFVTERYVLAEVAKAIDKQDAAIEGFVGLWESTHDLRFANQLAKVYRSLAQDARGAERERHLSSLAQIAAQMHARVEELRSSHERGERRPESLHAYDLRALAYDAFIESHLERGDLSRALDALTRALTIAEDRDNEMLLGRIHYTRGNIRQRMQGSDLVLAVDDYREAISFLEITEPGLLLASSYENLASVLLKQGNLVEAEAYYVRASEMYRSMENVGAADTATYNRLLIPLQRGNFTKVEEVLAQQHTDDPETKGLFAQIQHQVNTMRGDVSASRASYGDIADIFRIDPSEDAAMGEMLVREAEAISWNDQKAAASLLAEVYGGVSEEDPWTMAFAYSLDARLRKDTLSRDQTRAMLDKVYGFGDSLHDENEYYARILSTAALLEARLGNNARAIELSGDALALADSFDAPYVQAHTRLMIALALGARSEGPLLREAGRLAHEYGFAGIAHEVERLCESSDCLDRERD